MGCLVNLIKIILGLIKIAIMLIVGYKLIFDPYRPESPNSSWSQRPAVEETYAPKATEPPKRTMTSEPMFLNRWAKPMTTSWRTLSRSQALSWNLPQPSKMASST